MFHEDPVQMVIEAIDEYLLLAEYGINFQKARGGILGYPSALLLLSVIEILGSYSVRNKEHFQVLRQPCFGLTLTVPQVKKIQQWYRHLLAHNGFIALGALLSPDNTGDPFVLDENGQPTILRVKPLFHAVKAAWERFDKRQIDPARRMKEKHSIATPIDLRGSPASEIAASSGAPVNPKQFMKEL